MAVLTVFHFEILSLYGPETQAKVVAVNPPRKKLKETMTQSSVKLHDGFSHNSDIQMLKLDEMKILLRECRC